MASKKVRTQIEGLDYVVLVPDTVTQEDYQYGLIVGPPESISTMELNVDDLIRRLHKELYVRDLITYDDVVKRRADVMSALQAVLKLDVEKIIEVYRNGRGSENRRT